MGLKYSRLNFMSSPAFFHREGDVQALFSRLGACQSVVIVTDEVPENLPDLTGAERRRLTLKELLAVNPVCAYTADANSEHDQFVISNNRLVVRLTAQSDSEFGFVSNEKSKAKGHYTYDLSVPLNKRVRWALDNTVMKPYDFLVHSSHNPKITPRSRALRIAMPPLEYAVSKKRTRAESENLSSESEDLDLLGFDDWASEFVEWAGLVVLNPQLLAENNGGVDPAICNYFAPEGSQMQNVAVVQYLGPVLAADVEELYKYLSKSSVLIVTGVPQLIDRPLKGGHHKPKPAKADKNGAILLPNNRFFEFSGY